jgi:hypothetical protein
VVEAAKEAEEGAWQAVVEAVVEVVVAVVVVVVVAFGTFQLSEILFAVVAAINPTLFSP